MTAELEGYIVELYCCWDDHTWSEEVQFYVATEEDVDNLPDLYARYAATLPEAKIHYNDGGLGGLVHVGIHNCEYASNYELGEVLLRCGYYCAFGQILEIDYGPTWEGNVELLPEPEPILESLKLAAEFQYIFGKPLARYTEGGVFSKEKFAEDFLQIQMDKPEFWRYADRAHEIIKLLA